MKIKSNGFVIEFSDKEQELLHKVEDLLDDILNIAEESKGNGEFYCIHNNEQLDSLDAISYTLHLLANTTVCYR